MNRWSFLFVLFLPFIVLGASLIRNEAALSGSETFRIPVTGFDPRDVLRGQYVRVAYDVAVTGDMAACEAPRCRLCLDGPPPDGRRARIIPEHESCAYEVAFEPGELSLSRQTASGDSGGDGPIFSRRARLFVDERIAASLDRQLREEPMVMVTQLTRTGRLVPVRLEADNWPEKEPAK